MDCIPSESDDSCGTGAGRIDPASVKIESGTSEEGSGREHEKNGVKKKYIALELGGF
mgnify:CR=1 FL=1